VSTLVLPMAAIVHFSVHTAQANPILTNQFLSNRS
jgi:hypothetical protein